MSNERLRLHNTRKSTTFSFEHQGISFHGTYSTFESGSVAELFIATNKAGSDLDACVRDLGVTASLALQFGCSVETLSHALLRNADGSAATPLGQALDIITEQEGEETTKG